jgi:hypothetical protein
MSDFMAQQLAAFTGLRRICAPAERYMVPESEGTGSESAA